MSRASDVRDALAAALRLQDLGATVDVFLIPAYDREELIDSPRVVVRVGGRELTIDQGADTRNIVIEVGVVGVTPLREELDTDEYREAQIAKCDEFDELMEQVIGLFTPDGPLRSEPMAGHQFFDLTQAIQFDPQKLYSENTWLSLIRLTYTDSIDEED
jgi:hypothetical protein